MAEKSTKRDEHAGAAVKAATGVFGLFVVAVAGSVVGRYGEPGTFIGAVRTREKTELGVTLSGWAWDTKTVHALTKREAAKYRREYARAFASKALKQVDEAAFLEQVRASALSEYDSAAEAKKQADEAKKQADADAQKATPEGLE